MPDLSGPLDCHTLVAHFYALVVEDPLLGPIFRPRIEDWDAHLETMTRFWSTLLFGTSTFQGDVFRKHVPLPIGAEHFTRWLALWRESVQACFAGPRADEAVSLAERMAQGLSRRLMRVA